MRRLTLLVALVVDRPHHVRLRSLSSHARRHDRAEDAARRRAPEIRGSRELLDGADNLFGPLFRYISKHDIAMTTPVEARVEGAAMFSWVATSERGKVAGNDQGVEVVEVPSGGSPARVRGAVTAAPTLKRCGPHS